MFCPFSAFRWGLEQVVKDGPKSLLTNKPGCLFSTGRGVTEDTHVAGQVFLPEHWGCSMPALSDDIQTDLRWSIGKLFIISNTLGELQKLLKPKVSKGQSLDF